jgi:AAA domain
MKTIVIADQKGGSGESTTIVHLAVAAEMAGDGPVVISDTDPQSSTVDWFDQRKRAAIDTPRYAQLIFSDQPHYLRALKDAGAGYTFIDTAPSIGGVTRMPPIPPISKVACRARVCHGLVILMRAAFRNPRSECPPRRRRWPGVARQG